MVQLRYPAVVYAAIDLMLKTPAYRDWRINTIEGRIAAALAADRAAGFVGGNGELEVFFTWAFLTPEQEQVFSETEKVTDPAIWAQGPEDGQFWIVEMIAPVDKARRVRDLRAFFREKYGSGLAKWYRHREDGTRRFCHVRF